MCCLFAFCFPQSYFSNAHPQKLFLGCLIFPALMNRDVISYAQWDMPFSVQVVHIIGIPGGVQHLSEQYLPETERACG